MQAADNAECARCAHTDRADDDGTIGRLTCAGRLGERCQLAWAAVGMLCMRAAHGASVRMDADPHCHASLADC